MELIFVCPETDEIFKSANFCIADNQGIQTDENGHKFLDAKVKLHDRCPFCGKHHEYHVNELSCPFAG